MLREAVAWGADAGLHVCDPAFAGSDTLATARALAAALDARGPFDLVLVGRNSLDGETGQVGPELAELLGLPFAGGVQALEDAGGFLRLELEHDDGTQEVEVDLPAVLSVAERLCEPCKVDPEGRAAVDAARLPGSARPTSGRGPGARAGARPWWAPPARWSTTGPAGARRSAGRGRSRRPCACWPGGGRSRAPPRAARRRRRRGPVRTGERASGDGSPVAVCSSRAGPRWARELLAAAARLAEVVGGRSRRWRPAATAAETADGGGRGRPRRRAGRLAAGRGRGGGRHRVRAARRPWAVLAPSTAFGREVAARAAAATGSGLVGDAVALSCRDGVLVAAKPAFAGALVADITCRSATSMVTVRPGVLPAAPARRRPGRRGRGPAVPTRGRVRLLAERRNDDVETLARADVVIGVGAGVDPDEYEQLSPLAAVLGAELAATRKVTDKGWAPRARQVGITGRSIAPRLYVAIGLSGKFNHMVGVRAAGTILAVNEDRGAPVFEHCDIGIVGDWHEAVPLLRQALRRAVGG